MKVLKSKGYNELTTTGIAKQLGVSVGSIYEYFPNKDAIIYAIFETTAVRAANELRESIYRDILADDTDFDYEHGAYQSVEKHLSIFEEHGHVLIKLVDDFPSLKNVSKILCLENIIHNASRIFMETRSSAMSVDDLEVLVFITTNTTFRAVRKYVSAEEKPCNRELFKKEITGLLIAYYMKKGILHKKRSLEAQVNNLLHNRAAC